jgi:hypothetical protein
MVAHSQWFEQIIGQHIAAAAASLLAEVVEAARGRGRDLDLDVTVAQWLRE